MSAAQTIQELSDVMTALRNALSQLSAAADRSLESHPASQRRTFNIATSDLGQRLSAIDVPKAAWVTTALTFSQNSVEILEALTDAAAIYRTQIHRLNNLANRLIAEMNKGDLS